MSLTASQVQDANALIDRAIAHLSIKHITPVRITEFIPAHTRFFITKKARFIDLAVGWQLGVLLLTSDGGIHTAGESTRAVPPGHPGHVSLDRERRREFMRIAFEHGFTEGEVLYFNSPAIPLEVGQSLPNDAALVLHNETLSVRWNRNLPVDTSVPLERYLNEQLALKTELNTTG